MKRIVTTFITAVITVPTILFVCALCAFVSNFIASQKVETLHDSVDNLSGYITATYHAQLNGITDLINNDQVRAFIDNPNDQNLRANATRIFSDTFNFNDNIYESTLFSPDGNILLTIPENSTTSESDMAGFEKVVSSHQPYVTIGIVEEMPLLNIVYPVMQGDTLIGVYDRFTPLIYLSEYAHTTSENDESILIIANDTGLEFNADGDGKAKMDFISNINQSSFSEIPSIDELVKDYSGTNDSGTINYSLQNVSRLGFYKKLPEMHWICMISQSRAKIFYALNVFQLITILVSIFMILIIFYITRNSIVSLTREFADSNNVIKSFLKGDFHVRTKQSTFDVVNDLNDSINNLLDEFTKGRVYLDEVEYQLNTVVATDPITKLGNNVALYRAIDDNFHKNDKQALIMFNLEGYDEVSETFGNSVANRLLEIVAETLKNIDADNIHLTRLGNDTFCIYISEYNDAFDVTDLSAYTYKLLKSIKQIDDLQILLKPRMAIIYKNQSLLGRSDWLGLANNKLQQANQEKKPVIVLDNEAIERSSDTVEETFENILNNDTEAFQGFSKSQNNQ